MKRILSAIIPAILLAACSTTPRAPLQILFTNDSHSQVEPINGLGGFEARMAVVDSLRAANPNTILLDAGDIFQGTSYFNMFDGRLEVEAYNLMAYDAMTLGNHEFDNGVDSLAARVREMRFPVVCANYDFGSTPLAPLVRPYTVIERGGWRVGVIGVGVNPESLILQDNIAGITYLDPVGAVNRYASELRRQKGCNLVVVLSHLGIFDNSENQVTDDRLAAETSGVDLILGGHTHSRSGFYRFASASGDSVSVAQETKAGQHIYSVTVE